MNSKQLGVVAWGLSVVTVTLAVAVWLDASNNRIIFNAFSVFPLLGLSAFSLMWVHYIIGAKRRYFNVPKEDLKPFFKATSAIVLAAILLHPGLLILQLWQRGFGLPPYSYLEHYVAPSAKWAAVLGTLSLLVFLAFEFHDKFGDRSWWKWVDLAQVVAMAAVFVHGLRLGGELQITWYRYVWMFYGLSLIIAVCYTYYPDLKSIKERL